MGLRHGVPRHARRGFAWGGLSALALALGSAHAASPPSTKPVEPETAQFLAKKGLAETAPIYIRIFKEDSELEVWKERPGGRFVHIKTYPICAWSGRLGPKEALGDQMAPEGFYGFTADGLKPDSKYHLALNVGYPNALDRALGRTGDFIMVHGKCVSVGCFAMTDDLIEEIYALARDAIAGGQAKVPIHVFPFRMTKANMEAHTGHPASGTWAPLKEAYDDFEKSRLPPRIAMCSKRYLVNPIWTPAKGLEAEPDVQCPANPGKLIAPVSRRLVKRLNVEPLVALGPKTRSPEDIAGWDDSSAKATVSDLKRREDLQKERQTGETRPADLPGMMSLIGH